MKMRLPNLLSTIVLVAGMYSSLDVHAQTITTFAGTGGAGYSGDGGQATAALLAGCTGVCRDMHGNVYISDRSNNCIRKVDASGIISTFAGTGASGYSGDGGPASAAMLHYPYGVSADRSGNIYIAGYLDHCVRKVNTAGVITTIAGTGSYGFSGDGGPATAAQLYCPLGTVIDPIGNVYIADYGNYCIRKIDTFGNISTYGGIGGTPGFEGDGGPATAGKFGFPQAVALDAAGNLYVADEDNYRVRMITPAGLLSTFAGNGSAGYTGDGVAATAAEINHPTGVAVDDAGNVYISDYYNYRVRVVNTAGIINTLAGSGADSYGGDGGPATAASMTNPCGLSYVCGNLYIADWNNNVIRAVNIVPPPIIGPVAGTDSVCPGHIVILSDTLAGGIWASKDTGIATIDSAGRLSGVRAGSDTVYYIVTNSCGTDTASLRIVVPVHSSCNEEVAGVENSAPSFSIFPNPNAGEFSLKLSKTDQEDVQIVVTNTLGATVLVLNTTTNTINDVQITTPPGIYFVAALTKDETFNAKIVVE